MIARFLLLTLSILSSPGMARGDLNQYMVRTTEWLVDHSSVICVAQFADERSDSIEKILVPIKGDFGSVKGPLKKMNADGYFYYGPPAQGTVRLLFIGENQELWQAVGLGRRFIDSPTLNEAFYGVDQYGRVHLTEQSLMNGIRSHMAAPPSIAVARRKSSPHFKRSGIDAPKYFPFESGGETFVLVVDFNERRRDFYLHQLEVGDGAERIHAIYELSQLHDPKARAAIEDATTASGVAPSHAFYWFHGHATPQAADAVRSAARNALERLDQEP